MFEEFKKHLEDNSLCRLEDKILLTVSGGIDSMAMLHLFQQAGYYFGIAHCNFMLRGSESDEDQNFVRSFAQRNSIDFYTEKFNTSEYARKNKVSIQMAARDLRYKWFDEIASKNGFTKIATAHNLNDIAETFFINLTRGSGIKGLSGIPVQNGIIIRPILFASRKNIEKFVLESKIEFREDSSNADTKYLRNAIRHKIIPEFEAIAKNFLSALEQSTQLLNVTSSIYYQHIQKLRQAFLQKYGDGYRISIKHLQESNLEPEIVYDILSDYGFSYDTAVNLLKTLNAQSGKIFYSGTHEIIKDREYLFLTPIKIKNDDKYYIKNIKDIEHLPIKLSIRPQVCNENYTISREPNTATFDCEKISFPLELRHKKEGDYFYPFGMKGKKKLSDFFSDIKFSHIEKENTWLLLSGNEIIWVVGHRTSNNCKITKNTKEIIEIKWIG